MMMTSSQRMDQPTPLVSSTSLDSESDPDPEPDIPSIPEFIPPERDPQMSKNKYKKLVKRLMAKHRKKYQKKKSKRPKPKLDKNQIQAQHLKNDRRILPPWSFGKVSCVFDLTFFPLMTSGERVSMSQQIIRSYYCNLKAKNPFAIHFVGTHVFPFPSKFEPDFSPDLVTVADYLTKADPQFPKWVVYHHKSSLIESLTNKNCIYQNYLTPQLYPNIVLPQLKEQFTQEGLRSFKYKRLEFGISEWEKPPFCPQFIPKTKIVYLTPDSETVLETIDPNSCYVIGAFVDKNRHPRKTLETAKEYEISTARLNLSDFNSKGYNVFTVDQVFSILLQFLDSNTWKGILDTIPARKKRKNLPSGTLEPSNTKKPIDDENSDDDEIVFSTKPVFSKS